MITGHTGFKGTWLTFLLEHLKVPMVGYSLGPQEDSLYKRAKRLGCIPEMFADIEDKDCLNAFLDDHKPSAIIHLAAQPLVLKSYEAPLETFRVNVMGTATLLNTAFSKEFVRSIIAVTTDKVYRNQSEGIRFIESDSLEGKDPYSASKVGTESVISAWQQIAHTIGGPQLTSVRAGNVVGGGDWAQDRLIPDLIRGQVAQKVTHIRNPESTRPWQHVLDPLVGYLNTLEITLQGNQIKSVNFGPDEDSLPVARVTEIAIDAWPELKILIERSQNEKIEAKQLDLDSTFAKKIIGWEPKFSQEDAVRMTINWWKNLIKEDQSASKLCNADIEKYFSS
jgi:CDP-glucose 4,6-dehydratase